MNANRIEMMLEGITVGKTTTICGLVVTRWSKTSWEVETWGRKAQTIDEAVGSIIAVVS